VVVVARWEWHLGLEPPLQEVLDLEAEHVVELHLVVGEHAGPHLGRGEVAETSNIKTRMKTSFVNKNLLMGRFRLLLFCILHLLF